MTINEKLINFIQNTYPVSGLGAKIIADNFHYIEYKKGDHLLKAGKICSDYLFLQTGMMRAYTCDTDGNEVTTNFFSEPQMVFEVTSYFQRKPSVENIHTLADCTGWVGKYETFQQLFHSLPEFREFGRAILVKEYIAFKERTLQMITLKAEERYEQLLRTNPKVFQFAQLKQIASYLGITDTSLSRIRKEFTHK